MYYIAYRDGRKVADGYAPTAADAVGQFPGTYELEGTLGDEEKWIDTSGRGPAVYVRPTKNQADPNATLARIREQLAYANSITAQAENDDERAAKLHELKETILTRIADAVADLDEHLSNGGSLPEVWRGARSPSLRLVELLTAYGAAKFGDEWWPGNAAAFLGEDAGRELALLLDKA